MSSLHAGMGPVLAWTSSNPPGMLPVRGDKPAELRYHLSIMAQPPHMWGWILFWSFMLNNHYTREEPSHDTKPRVHHHYVAWLTIAVLSAIALLNFVADQ